MTRVRAFSGADLWAAKRVMEHCYLGDWFVLYQLSKNSNSQFFRYLLRHMDRSLNCQVAPTSFSGLVLGGLLEHIVKDSLNYTSKLIE